MIKVRRLALIEGLARSANRAGSPLTVQDGVGNGHAAHPGQLGDRMVQADVDLIEGLCICSTLREAVLTGVSR